MNTAVAFCVFECAEHKKRHLCLISGTLWAVNLSRPECGCKKTHEVETFVVRDVAGLIEELQHVVDEVQP